MQYLKTAQALLLMLSLTALNAQAHTQNIGKHANWPINGQTHSNHQDIQWQAPRNNHSDADNGYEQHSKRHNHGRHHGYNKPKNPYNNGIHSPNRVFYRGDQLPVQYRGDRGQRYVIADWHSHDGLYAPPVGMRWTYIDGRYILATIATGIIYNIIYGN